MMKKLLIGGSVVLLLTLLVVWLLPDTKDIGKGLKGQFETYLKDKTVLPRAKSQLSDAVAAREKAAGMSKELRVDVKADERQIERIQAEIDKTREAFVKLQDIAKEAGLPKRVEATDEDKQKSILVAGKQQSGAEVYRTLLQFKNELKRGEEEIKRKKTVIDFKNKRIDVLAEHDSVIADKIMRLEALIADYETYHELLAVHKRLEEIDIPNDTMAEILNMNGTFGELQKEVDRIDILLGEADKKTSTADIKDALVEKTSFNVTDDDLL